MNETQLAYIARKREVRRNQHLRWAVGHLLQLQTMKDHTAAASGRRDKVLRHLTTAELLNMFRLKGRDECDVALWNIEGGKLPNPVRKAILHHPLGRFL